MNSNALVSVDAVTGEYETSDKYIALMFLEFTANEVSGDFIPSWEVVHNALGVPIDTLKDWWKNRKEIQKALGHGAELLPEIIATKLKLQTFAALKEVDRRGLETFSNKDLITFIKESVQIVRLLENKSNLNISLGVGYCDTHVKIK